MRNSCYIFLIASFFVFSACNPHKKELYETIEQMKSTSISIPYEQMVCWGNDSVLSESPWEKAKLKMVHYIDSATCSSCYLQKISNYDFLFHLEKKYNSEFYNVFITNPKGNSKKILESDFYNGQTPPTIFIDSANVFLQKNNAIPSEIVYHTFLLDENNKVILVGNPMASDKIEKMLQTIVEEKLGKRN